MWWLITNSQQNFKFRITNQIIIWADKDKKNLRLRVHKQSNKQQRPPAAPNSKPPATRVARGSEWSDWLSDWGMMQITLSPVSLLFMSTQNIHRCSRLLQPMYISNVNNLDSVNSWTCAHYYVKLQEYTCMYNCAHMYIAVLRFYLTELKCAYFHYNYVIGKSAKLQCTCAQLYIRMYILAISALKEK